MANNDSDSNTQIYAVVQRETDPVLGSDHLLEDSLSRVVELLRNQKVNHNPILWTYCLNKLVSRFYKASRNDDQAAFANFKPLNSLVEAYLRGFASVPIDQIQFCFNQYRNVLIGFNALSITFGTIESTTELLSEICLAYVPIYEGFTPMWYIIEANNRLIMEQKGDCKHNKCLTKLFSVASIVNFDWYVDNNSLYDDIIGFYYYSAMNMFHRADYKTAHSHCSNLRSILAIGLPGANSANFGSDAGKLMSTLKSLNSVFFIAEKIADNNNDYSRRSKRKLQDSQRFYGHQADPTMSLDESDFEPKYTFKLRFNDKLSMLVLLTYYLRFPDWQALPDDSNSVYQSLRNKLVSSNKTDDQPLNQLLVTIKSRKIRDVLSLLPKTATAVSTNLQKVLETSLLPVLISNVLKYDVFQKGANTEFTTSQLVAIFDSLDTPIDDLIISWVTSVAISPSTPQIWQYLGSEDKHHVVIEFILSHCADFCGIKGDLVYYRRNSSCFDPQKMAAKAQSLMEFNSSAEAALT